MDQRQRRRLQHEKAEARARYNEGRRLAEQRDAHRNRLRGAYQPAPSFSSWQLNLLERWDSGVLLQELNGAVAAWNGEHLDIGGSTGGVSRRLVDGWVPPDWREFLSRSDTVQEFLSHTNTV